MPAFVVNVFRFLVSASVLGVIYWMRTRREHSFFAPLLANGRRIVGLGLLGYVLYQVLFILGLHHTTSGSAALVMASSPLWTALLSDRLNYDYLPSSSWWALLLSLVGTGIVVVAGPQAVDLSDSSLLGNALMLGAAVAWGVYTTLNKPVLQDVSPTGLTFFGLAAALPALAALAWPFMDAVAWHRVDAGVWTAIVFSGAFSTGVAYVIWNTAVRSMGPSYTAVYNNLVPFVALITGFLFLGEAITWVQVVGGLLIIGGLVIMRRSKHGAPLAAECS